MFEDRRDHLSFSADAAAVLVHSAATPLESGADPDSGAGASPKPQHAAQTGPDDIPGLGQERGFRDFIEELLSVRKLNSFRAMSSVKGIQSRTLLAGLALLGSSSVLLLSGCSSTFHPSVVPSANAVQVTRIAGKVHGGQQPVAGATVQIYEVSVAGAGYGAAAAPVQQNGTTVMTTTDPNGNWTYPVYTCTSASDELYVLATQGNSGSGNNAALSLAAALGTCGNVANIGFVFVDEVTTVATAYSLAGFMTNSTSVGTSSTNAIGLTNAFATFNNLVNLNTGQALTVTPAYATAPANASPDVFNSIVPYDSINTLADVLSSCVNTDGTGSGCSSLFALTGGVADTMDAALYIAHNPGLLSSGVSNVSALFDLVPPNPPFQPTLLSAPTDFSLTLNFISGGLGGVKTTSRSGGQNIAVDANGNVWIPNNLRQSVTELSNLGAPLSPTTTTNQTSPYAPIQLGGWGASVAGLFTAPRSVAIDQNGNAWIADESNCLVALNSSGSPLTGAPFTGACPAGSGATGVAVDAADQVWASGATFITATNGSGMLASGFPVSGYDSLTGFLGADYAGHTWWIDGGNNHYGALNSNGTTFVTSTTLISGPDSYYAAFGLLASGAGGNGGLALWVPEGQGGTLNVQPINVTGSINNLPNALLPSTEAGPEGIASDGNSTYYIVNGGGDNGGNTIPANLTILSSKGSMISPPDTGIEGGSALTVLGAPTGVTVDQSGNVWVVNTTNNNPQAPGQILGPGQAGHANVTEFVGLAAPAQPVFSLAAQNQTYGVEP